MLSARAKFVALLAVVSAAFTSTAKAEAVNLGQMTLGYTYYNRPGADLNAHNAAVMECTKEAVKSIATDEAYQAKVDGGLVGGIIASHYHRGAVGASLENCMVVRGWRVVQMPEAVGKSLALLQPGALSTRLSPWVGAAIPEGRVVRVWNNDAMDGNTNRFVFRPAHEAGGQLSLKIATGKTLADVDGLRPADFVAKHRDPKIMIKRLKIDEIGSVPPGFAIVLLRVAGSAKAGGMVRFIRGGEASESEQPWFSAGDVPIMARKNGSWAAFAVPPGRWRLASASAMSTISFCLGAPSFEARAGDMIYAGTFNFISPLFGPDLALEAAKPQLPAPLAERLVAAHYSNGWTGDCGDNAIYALEFKDVAFVPGYAREGALKSEGALTGP